MALVLNGVSGFLSSSVKVSGHVFEVFIAFSDVYAISLCWVRVRGFFDYLRCGWREENSDFSFYKEVIDVIRLSFCNLVVNFLYCLIVKKWKKILKLKKFQRFQNRNTREILEIQVMVAVIHQRLSLLWIYGRRHDHTVAWKVDRFWQKCAWVLGSHCWEQKIHLSHSLRYQR